ncbi:type IV secretory pathway TrbL component [Pseudomonas sp. F-14 TE3623]
MSFTVGFPNAAAITIAGKSPATINALSEATSDASAQALGKEEGSDNQVRTGGAAQTQGESKSEKSGGQSIAVQVLLKRMQELQQQLREQQQQLAAAQAANYPTPEAKATAVMSIQGQIADTSGALAQVTGNLVKELAKGSMSGNLVSTMA